jgi:hypothetical protein
VKFGARHGSPYYGGAATVSAEINEFIAALDGRPYEIDWKNGGVQYQTVPLLRDQADDSQEPGKQSINPEAFWQRSTSSWHLGAGQSTFDREGSSPYRFRESKGVDVSERWELSLLNQTRQGRESTNTNLHQVVAGTYLYITDGTSLLYTQDIAADPPSWTSVTGGPATAASSMTSDGFAIYTAHAANGIYRTTRGAATTASWVTGTVDLVVYAKDRLMAAAGASVYNITASGALPSALFAHPNTDFTWVGFAAGDTHIYAAGKSGDKSLIYRTRIKDDGTGLDALVVAGELPDGEIVTGIYGYLGFIVLGSDKGLRFATVGSTGDLTIGAFIPVGTGNVEAFEGQDRYVWFGWPDFDVDGSGLGRIDLQNFSDTERLTPAYASDLMANRSYLDASPPVTASTPDVFSFTDINMWVRVALDDWTPGGFGTIVLGQYETGNQGCTIGVNPSGNLTFSFSTNGSVDTTRTSTAATGFTNGTEHIIGVAFDADNGAAGHDVRFYTWDLGGTPVQLGSTVTTAGVITLFNSTAPLTIGPIAGFALNGKVYDLAVGTGSTIDSSIVARARLINQGKGSTTWLDDQGHTWSMSTNTQLSADAMTGAVKAISTFQSRRVFSVAGRGFFIENTSVVVPEGHLDTGEITYNLAEPKIALGADLIATGERELWISVDGAAFVRLGIQGGTPTPYPTGSPSAADFELRLVLKRDVGGDDEGAIVTGWALRSQPTSERTTLIIAALLLAPIIDRRNSHHVYDSLGAWDHIVELAATRAVVQWQLGTRANAVILEDYELPLESIYKGDDGSPEGINGTCTVKMKVVT